MGPGEIEALFTRSDGQYLFARWGRPIVPVVFGVDDASLSVFKGAFEAVVTLAGHKMSEMDPELGVNLMVFCFREWQELLAVRDLDRLVPELDALVARLEAGGANQYRIFRFDCDGAIKAAFVFLKMDAALVAMEAETLALAQAALTVVLWSDRAFNGTALLAMHGDRVILRPQIGAVIRAGYDPVMPVVARDPTHALRLAARVSTVDN